MNLQSTITSAPDLTHNQRTELEPTNNPIQLDPALAAFNSPNGPQRARSLRRDQAIQAKAFRIAVDLGVADTLYPKATYPDPVSVNEAHAAYGRCALQEFSTTSRSRCILELISAGWTTARLLAFGLSTESISAAARDAVDALDFAIESDKADVKTAKSPRRSPRRTSRNHPRN